MDDPLPAEINEVRWNEALRRADAIRDFLRRYPEGSTAADVEGLADELELSRASTYRLIKLFRAGGTATSLVDRKRGRRKGHRTLDDARHKIIRSTILRFYLKRTRPPFAKLVREVQANCIAADLEPPHLRTIKARLEDIDLQRRAKLRGDAKLVKATMATPGELLASRPLEIVQIDHTKADIFVVDEETRKPVGRPWLTLAMDVYTRMITGFYLTMEAPSRLSTSLCLLHSVFDKSAWLREREILDDWPVAGLPEMLHVDNGADFRSRAFARGCRDAGVRIDWRPPGAPRFGGHIERLIGTHMGALHLLPGSTASNIQERGDCDPNRHSCLTLRELERHIALEIVGSYHHSIHAGLGRPPIAVWKEIEGDVPLRLPQDRMRFWLSFLPEDERTLRPDGIHLFRLRYWSPALSADLGRTKGRLLVKYDPRDMSRIFVRRPSGGFVEARYADVTLPSVTLREAQTARRALLKKGRGEINMRTIIHTVILQRKLVHDAATKTAKARQKKRDGSQFKVKNNSWGSLRGVDSSKPVSFVEDAD
jgi:putative transposase